MRICSGAGCLRVVPEGVRFCDECRPTRTYDSGREHLPGNSDGERYAWLYKGPRWKKHVQPRIMRRDLYCRICGLNRSELVDHKVPAGEAIRQAADSGRYPLDRYAGFYLQSNLRGVCRPCHGTKTAEDKAHVGPWPSVLEDEDRQPRKQWTF